MMSKQDMKNLDPNEKSDHDDISTEMLEDIRDGSQTHLNVNKREAGYRIHDRVGQKEYQWKGALKSTRIMGKGLHKLFSTIVNEISQDLKAMGESGSEVSHFIPEPRNFSEVTKLSENLRKSWLKATFKEIKNLINNQNFLIEYQNEGEHVTTCMDVYKAKIQSDRSLDKLKFRIVVRGYL